MAEGFPTPKTLTPRHFDAGAPYRGTDLPQITSSYLNILFSTENLLKPPGDVINSSVLQQLKDTDESTRRLSIELIHMMEQQQPSETIANLSMVLTTSSTGPTPYYLPRVQRTLAHTHAIFLSNETASPSHHTSLSPEATKAASARFSTCIGQGAILSAKVMLQIMANIEQETEQRQLELEQRTIHRNSQTPTWQLLLNKAIEKQLTSSDTTLNNRGVLHCSLLKSWCKNLGITQSGSQIELANRLLRFLKLNGEVFRYGEEGEGENEEEDE